MPLMTDGESLKTAETSNFAKQFMLVEIVSAGLLPMVYTALKLGEQMESSVMNLLSFHFVSPTNWVSSSFVYYLLMSFIPMAINVVANFVFIPEIFIGQYQNIFFFALQCLESTVTGLLFAVMFKKGKSASISSFFVLLFVTCFTMLGFGTKQLTYVFSLFVPSFSMTFEY